MASLSLLDMVKFIQQSKSGFTRALAKAQLASLMKAELEAKKQAQQNFIGRNNRRLSGALFNSIFTSFRTEPGQDVPVGEIGTRGIPYGAVHEFGTKHLEGGVITPQKRQKLWIPSRINAGRMTPREFISLMKAQPSRYFMTDKGAFRQDGENQFVPLFYRVDEVRIKARPYLRPGIERGYKDFADRFERFFEQELDKT